MRYFGVVALLSSSYKHHSSDVALCSFWQNSSSPFFNMIQPFENKLSATVIRLSGCSNMGFNVCPSKHINRVNRGHYGESHALGAPYSKNISKHQKPYSCTLGRLDTFHLHTPPVIFHKPMDLSWFIHWPWRLKASFFVAKHQWHSISIHGEEPEARVKQQPLVLWCSRCKY